MFVGDSEILKQKFLERWAFAFKNTLLNIEPTQHCCIENEIFLRLLEKQKPLQLPFFFFFSPLLFRNNEEKKLYGPPKS